MLLDQPHDSFTQEVPGPLLHLARFFRVELPFCGTVGEVRNKLEDRDDGSVCSPVTAAEQSRVSPAAAKQHAHRALFTCKLLAVQSSYSWVQVLHDFAERFNATHTSSRRTKC